MNRIVSILFFCCLICVANAQERKLPKPEGYINDFDRIFTIRERAALDSMVKAFEKKTTIEIAVLTIDQSYTTTDKFDSLVVAMHNEWGVGKKEKNNGVLVAICNDFRKIRISTGLGVEKKLTNEETKEIINKIIIPEFRQGRFYEGVRKGLLAVMKEVQ